MKAIWNRCYEDFLMPSRLELYRQLLERALNAGYTLLSIRDYYRGIQAGLDWPRVLILRHDVDTDPGTVREMWNIERSLGTSGSYYFRLLTLDFPLMQEIEQSGGEASYHYEELADVIKQFRIRDRDSVRQVIDLARQRFCQNLSRLRQETGLPMTIVASHGDFANRKVGVCNHAILDAKIRREMGIELEVYDEVITSRVTSRHSDAMYPRFWAPAAPDAAIEGGSPVVYLLTHPRHWRCHRRANLKDDLQRCWEGLRYALPYRAGSKAA